MKRKIVASILGAAATTAMVSSSYGQGSVLWKNYNSSFTVTAPVTYASVNVPAGKAGLYVGSEFSADLLYSFTSSTSVTNPVAGSAIAFYGSGDSATEAGGQGLFSNLGTVSIPGYSSGDIWFFVQAYEGASYGAATVRGQSALIEFSSIATGDTPASGLVTGSANAITPFTAFTVSNVPEPTTLALGGLGLASLLALRRRKS